MDQERRPQSPGDRREPSDQRAAERPDLLDAEHLGDLLAPLLRGPRISDDRDAALHPHLRADSGDEPVRKQFRE